MSSVLPIVGEALPSGGALPSGEFEQIKYDDETSSDDEEHNSNNVYNLFKNGREYIYFNSKYQMMVPSFEFEEVYGEQLYILRNKCKDVTIDENGIKTYTFEFQMSFGESDSGSFYHWEPKCKYIYNDKELHEIAKKIRYMMEDYSDSVPWNRGCEEKDVKWYSESKFIQYFREEPENNEYKIKEYFMFFDENPFDNIDNYIITKRKTVKKEVQCQGQGQGQGQGKGQDQGQVEGEVQVEAEGQVQGEDEVQVQGEGEVQGQGEVQDEGEVQGEDGEQCNVQGQVQGEGEDEGNVQGEDEGQ
jgi:hypothetical protein